MIDPSLQPKPVVRILRELGEERPHAAAITCGAETITRRELELRAHLSERIVRYKIPRSFEFVDAPLRDDAGKVRRSELRDAAASRLARTPAHD